MKLDDKMNTYELTAQLKYNISSDLTMCSTRMPVFLYQR